MQVEKKCCLVICEPKKNPSDIKSVVENSFPTILLKSIENIAQKEGFITYEVDKHEISTDGGNYLGKLYEANIKGRTNNIKKDINVFFKHIIPGDNNKVFSVNEAYLKESFVYNELGTIFKELQDEAKIPSDDRLNMAKSYDDTNSEIIVLENLAKQGYTTPNRMDVMSLELAEKAVQQIARFHALGLVLKKKRQDYFKKNLESMRPLFYFDEEYTKFVSNLIKISTEKVTDESKKKLDKFISNLYEKLQFYLQDTSLPGCCICHGDYRQNNILVKEIDGAITKVVPVDYQLIYYGCPLNDFFYFIFTASDQEFRKNHFHNLKDFYYESLIHFLGYFDEDFEEVYPRKEFERQFKERLDYGLIVALYVSPFLFTSSDEVPDIGQDDVSALNFVVDDECHKRVQGVVDDYVKWGYL